MLFKVNFNRALVISFFWHLLCFFMFTIVIIPVGIRQEKLSDVYFLGSILDKRSFENEFKDLNPSFSLRQKDTNRLFSFDKGSGVAKPPEAYSKKDYLLREKPYKLSIDEITDIEKRLPGAVEEKSAAESKDNYSGIEGEAKNRAVLFKPMPPDYNELASTLQKDITVTSFKAKLKVVIAANGSVKTAESLQTCGYPAVDLAVIRYAKNWKFEPLSPDKPQNDQEGILLFEIGAKPPENKMSLNND